MLILFLLSGLVGATTIVFIEDWSIVTAICDLIGAFRDHTFNGHDFRLTDQSDRRLHNAATFLCLLTQAFFMAVDRQLGTALASH